jgi:NADH-quinone oxidoreductase subunit N
LAIQKKYPLIQISVLYLSILVIFFSFYLVYNEHLSVLEISCLNDTVIIDYVSYVTKLIIGLLSIFCLLMIQPYILNNRINSFEYFLLIIFAVLGLFLLCSSNDLLTSYLSSKLQSLSFYVLAAFKKDSTFSVDAGVKYFILGAFSSGLLLFGSSIIYGFSGTTNFEEMSIFFSSAEAVSPGISLGILCISAALLFKLSAAPFHAWAPDTYEGAPTSVSAFFAILPKFAIISLCCRLYFFAFYDLINV